MAWRLALALQADGWWLRSDIIWHKPNPIPESIKDRPVKAHEYLFLLAKSPKYYYDAEAIKERAVKNDPVLRDRSTGKLNAGRSRPQCGLTHSGYETRAKRSVWTVPTVGFKEAHFATFPPKLVEPCVLAGCPRGGVVLDPFGGAGTTALVANQHGRNAVLIELNPEYARLAEKRLKNMQGTLL